MDRRAWWAAVHGVARVRHDWATSLSLSTFMHWRRKWQPTPLFLPGESQGWGSLVGCHLRGRTVGQDGSDLAAAATEDFSEEGDLHREQKETRKIMQRRGRLWVRGALRMCQQLQGGQGKKIEHMWQSTDMAEDMVREWEEEITW